VHGTVIERLDTTPAEAAAEDEGEEEEVAGPIAIAVDLADSDEAAPPEKITA
jgi:exoribonuclease-2